MDKLVLRELASQITTELISRTWYWWVLAAIVWIAASAIAAYFGGYLKVKSEMDAIDENMQKVLKNLDQTTTLTKSIETKIDHDDWATREWKTITRSKIEEIMREIGALHFWRQQEALDVLSKLTTISQCPHINNINVLVYVYLPEAKNIALSLTKRFEQARDWLISQKALIQAATDDASRQAVILAATDEWKSTYEYMSEVHTLREHCANVMSFITPQAPLLPSYNANKE